MAIESYQHSSYINFRVNEKLKWNTQKFFTNPWAFGEWLPVQVGQKLGREEEGKKPAAECIIKNLLI